MVRPDAYRIEATEFDLSLSLEPIPELWPHEDIVEDHATALERDIDGVGLLRNPIIADRETNVVLDGMHRLTAMDRLGHVTAPVCYVPYRDLAVEVGSWRKRFAPGSEDRLSAVVESLDVPVTRVAGTDRHPPAEIDHPLLIGPDRGYELEVSLASLEAYGRVVDAVTRTFQAAGFEPTLVADSKPRSPPGGGVVLHQPVPAKATVIRAATEGPLLPANTSRHVIPSRPVGVDVPVELLNRPVDEGNRLLAEHLRNREIVRDRPSDDRFERTYDESVLEFR